jgi:hypothetical protein
MRFTYVVGVSLSLLSLYTAAQATVVGRGTIEQPLNLGLRSDPRSIPLAPVAYEANHGYGVHLLISQSRPCQHGTLLLEDGQELEQNLARVFGISVEPEDSTQVPHRPVVLRVKSWPKPAYSPYSREQVLAATLQCLTRSAGGSPKFPLVVRIETEDPADQAWAAKYAGEYISRPNSDAPASATVEPTPVPGTRIEIDAFGVTRVVFPAATGEPAREPRPPLWIPFRLDGESGPTEPTWELLPVWTGDDWSEPLDALGQPYLHLHDLFNPASSFGVHVNALFQRGQSKHWTLSREPARTVARLDFDEVSEGDLAAFLHALVLSVRPTEAQPLEVELRCYTEAPSLFDSYAQAGWEKITIAGDDALRGTFVLDPATGKLRRGTIPRHTLEGYGSGSMFVTGPSDDTGDLSRELHSSYQWHFMHGMKKGAFEPTADEIQRGLGESQADSMQGKFWHAGYREALLEFYDPARLGKPDGALAAEDNELSRYRQSGWRAGQRRGHEIGAKILAEQRAEQEKAGR